MKAKVARNGLVELLLCSRQTKSRANFCSLRPITARAHRAGRERKRSLALALGADANIQSNLYATMTDQELAAELEPLDNESRVQ